ncbi:uncharacterized protein LOC131068013 isoform X3 [Cryptomeria japonica]|uniref:uncharacterized protein LOC131068013 isoform X3 n=1 Tax=Cryptomeria japonica TaxID=3369 RepID=UPI0027DA3690|nr:uncharacterized protein LOC131068013 isoform X3 [Cryptomeria japonica]
MLGLHSVQTGHIRTLTSDVGWRSAPLHNLKVETTNKKSHLVEAVSLDRTHLEKDDLKGKTVTVLGLGVSGRAATRLALARGATVVAVDSNESMIPLEHDPLFGGWHFTNLRTELGQCNIQYLSNSDRIVVSPGVSLEKYNLTALMQSGVQVMSELDFAAESIPTTVKVVAVTGTNGKSTVATFTGQAAVVEVSSYQMEIPNRHFKPSVAVVLNLTPDHLERHKTMQNYAMMKCRLFSHMDPSHLAVIPSGDQLLEEAAYCCGSQGTRAWIGDLPGVKLDGEAAQATILVPTLGIMSQIYLGNLKTIGMHNAYNAGTAALLALGLDLGVDFEAVNHAMEVLEPPPHRMQVVTKDDQGVLWVDDSKATNVEATYAGLEGLRGQPSVVLLGGIAKVLNKEGHIGFERLVDCLKYHKAVITFGASGKKIKQTLDGAGISIPCVEVTSMRDAVSTAKFFAKHGDAILLSPGCASFDEFENFEHRGKVFQELATSFLGSQQEH